MRIYCCNGSEKQPVVARRFGADESPESIVAGWSLLYKFTKDGKTPADFHRCVNGKSRVLVVIRQEDSPNTFGCFLSSASTGAPGWQSDPKAFIFTLVNSRGIAPTKYASTGTHTVSWSPQQFLCLGSKSTLSIQLTAHQPALVRGTLGNMQPAFVSADIPVDVHGRQLCPFTGTASAPTGDWGIAELLAFSV
jgi:hypothetical protein